jgi:hypothetical protein
MDNKTRLESSLKLQLVKLKSALEKMRIDARAADAKTRAAMDKKLVELDELIGQAEDKLAQLQAAGGDSWRKTEALARGVWDSLERELQAYNPDKRSP